MRKFIFASILLTLATACTGQWVRPNTFTEQTAPDNSNFELYSQKNGLPRRASLTNIKKFMDQYIYLSGDTICLTRADGDTCIYLGSISGASALDDLTDVTITAASNGQVLKYNGSAWVNGTDNAGSGGGLTYTFFQSDSANIVGVKGDIAYSLNTSGNPVVATFGVDSAAVIRSATINVAVPAGKDFHIRVIDVSGQTNTNFGNIWFPTINVYDTGATLLSLNTGEDVSHGNSATIPHNIEWGSGIATIKFGTGDFQSKSVLTVVMTW